MTEKSERVCPECGRSTLVVDEETNEVICSGCGLVVYEEPTDSMSRISISEGMREVMRKVRDIERKLPWLKARVQDTIVVLCRTPSCEKPILCRKRGPEPKFCEGCLRAHNAARGKRFREKHPGYQREYMRRWRRRRKPLPR